MAAILIPFTNAVKKFYNKMPAAYAGILPLWLFGTANGKLKLKLSVDKVLG
jgi:hypothetical protein